MRNFLLTLSLGILLSGCSTDRPSGTASTHPGVANEGDTSIQPLPGNTLSQLLKASRTGISLEGSAVQPEGTSVPAPATGSQTPEIRTVGDLLADPQFRAVVAALESTHK